jgi:hypothetical protein
MDWVVPAADNLVQREAGTHRAAFGFWVWTTRLLGLCFAACLLV